MSVVLSQPVATEEWRKLRAIIGEQIGSDPREILPDSRPIEDLGLD